MMFRIHGDLSCTELGGCREKSVWGRDPFARSSHSVHSVTFGGTLRAGIGRKKFSARKKTRKITYNKFRIVNSPPEIIRTVSMTADQTPRVRGPAMPRPRAPGALQFDKNNITKFLRKWNQECDDYGLSDEQRCIRLPDYCMADIETIVDCFSGYRKKDWTKFQEELRALVLAVRYSTGYDCPAPPARPQRSEYECRALHHSVFRSL
jgi:hypothetical protein